MMRQKLLLVSGLISTFAKTNNVSRKGTKLEYLPELEKDLMDKYWSISREGIHLQTEAFERTIASPAKRFYVSERRAYQVVLKLFKGDYSEVERMTPLRRALFFCIYEKAKELMKQRAYASCSLHFVIPIVVGSEAPRFFVSLSTFRRIFYNQTKK